MDNAMVGIRSPVMRIHDAAGIVVCELRSRRWNNWQWVNSKPPVGEGDIRSWHTAGWARIATAKAKGGRKDRGIGLLNHEQWNIQESLAVIQPISSTQNM